MASRFGVEISEPKQPMSEKPMSSTRMVTMFGALEEGSGSVPGVVPVLSDEPELPEEDPELSS